MTRYSRYGGYNSRDHKSWILYHVMRSDDVVEDVARVPRKYLFTFNNPGW